MSTQGRSDRRGDDGFAEDPERLSIAAELAEVAKSAAQVADATGLPLARVRRHLREMREEGLIESIVRKGKRGTVEHFNILVGGLMEDVEGLAKLTPAERRRLHGNVLRLILTEVTRALVTHPTDRGVNRLDVAVVRIPIITDETGWEELAKLHREFYDRVLEVRDRIAECLEQEGQEGFKASSVLLLHLDPSERDGILRACRQLQRDRIAIRSRRRHHYRTGHARAEVLQRDSNRHRRRDVRQRRKGELHRLHRREPDRRELRPVLERPLASGREVRISN